MHHCPAREMLAPKAKREEKNQEEEKAEEEEESKLF